MSASADWPRRLDGWLLGVLVVAGVLLEAWLLSARWVNPDEGAHLMDVRLAMEGLVPGVHFSARQPLYVYAHVPFFWLFRGSYVGARLLPLLATVAGGGMLYLIGRQLWSRTVGLIAALVYLASPTILVNAGVVKTEPLAILLVSVGLYQVVRYMEDRRWGHLLLAGALFATGFYVRESVLAGLLAAVVVVVVQIRDGWSGALRRLGALTLGAGLLLIGVLGFYWRYLPLADVLTRPDLNPVAAGLTRLSTMLGWWHNAETVTTGEVIRRSAQLWSTTHENLADAIRLNAHLIAGTMLAVVLWAWDGLQRLRGRPARERATGVLLAFAWLGSITLLYAYHIAQRGFFQFYFREFMPPMALLLAWVVVRSARVLGWESHAFRATVAFVVFAVVLFAVQRVFHGSWALTVLLVVGALGWRIFTSSLVTRGRQAAYLAGWIVLVAGAAFLHRGEVGARLADTHGTWIVLAGVVVLAVWGSWLTGTWAGGRSCAFAALACVLGATVWVASHSAKVLSTAYDCIWSPETVRAVAVLVRQHSQPRDEVLSGGVIWELEARRHPFMTISHPLVFINGMSSPLRQDILARLKERPPRIIVMDGYTEKTYLFQIPALEAMRAAVYDLVGEVRGSKRVVRVYVRKTDASGADALAQGVTE